MRGRMLGLGAVLALGIAGSMASPVVVDATPQKPEPSKGRGARKVSGSRKAVTPATAPEGETRQMRRARERAEIKASDKAVKASSRKRR